MSKLFLHLIAACLISLTICEKFSDGPVDVEPFEEDVFSRSLRRPGNLVPSFVRIGKSIPNTPKEGIQGMKRDGGPIFRYNRLNEAARYKAYLAMSDGINLRNAC